jgi:diphthamide synthase (EF-2-diphthine--ammonia ligase)
MIDESFLDDLPSGVDACGENGEFHSFVFDGPIFREPVLFQKGEIVHRTYEAPKNPDSNSHSDASPYGFYFCDLIPFKNDPK